MRIFETILKFLREISTAFGKDIFELISNLLMQQKQFLFPFEIKVTVGSGGEESGEIQQWALASFKQTSL